VIVSTARTAMAKSFRGSFNLTRPDDMAAHAGRGALKKVPKLDPTGNAGAGAAHISQVGVADAVVAGGLESITMLQNDFNKNGLFNPWLMDHKRDVYMPMGVTAGVVAQRS